jgi:hypothetical protein
MKNYCFALALLAFTIWPLTSWAASYAALEGGDMYAGGVLLVFQGDDAAGDSTSESFLGACVSGLNDQFVWQGFLALGLDDDATLLGGSADKLLAGNFDGGLPAEAGVWWLGAGGTLVVYRDSFQSGDGLSVSGEELGLNVGTGYFWRSYIASVYLHFFPDSSNTMISASVMRGL